MNFETYISHTKLSDNSKKTYTMNYNNYMKSFENATQYAIMMASLADAPFLDLQSSRTIVAVGLGLWDFSQAPNRERDGVTRWERTGQNQQALLGLTGVGRPSVLISHSLANRTVTESRSRPRTPPK